jgi:nitroreductase
MENLIQAIKNRHSTRNFNSKPVDKTILTELKSFIKQNNQGLNGEQITLDIIEVNPASDKKMKLDYGMIKNNHTYLLGEANKSVISRMNYGYIVEKVILKATELGIGCCWIGYFDNEYFKDYKISNPGNIPAIVILGYAVELSSFTKNFFKTITRSSSRKDWNDLFFENSSNNPLSKNIPHEYVQALEMLRLAPSAGNTQPWRVVYDRRANTFHFFKKPVSKRYEKDGLHDIDLGIALSHFDIALQVSKIAGKWHFDEIVKPENNWMYMISYTPSVSS